MNSCPVGGLPGLLLVDFLFPRTARSQYEGMYVAGAAGLVLAEDMDMGGPEAEIEGGWMGVGALGYAFSPGFRVEGAFACRTSAVERMNMGASLSGDVEASSFMFNLSYEYRRPDWPVAPFADVGLGVVRVLPDNVGPVLGSSLDDSDLGIVAQGIVGMAMDITDRIAATVEYRHLRTPDVTFGIRAGGKVDTNYAANQFMLGLRYRLGTGKESSPSSRARPLPEPSPTRRDDAGARNSVPPPKATPSEAPASSVPSAVAPAKPAATRMPRPMARVEKPVPVQSAALPAPRPAGG